MKLTKGTRIRWTASDAMGKFQHTGTVIRATKDVVMMESDEVGEMAFENNDGQIEVIGKTKSARRIDRARDRKEKRLGKSTTTKSTIIKAGTVKAQVFELLKGKTVTRSQAIAMIVDAGLSTPAGASTHFNSVKDLI